MGPLDAQNVVGIEGTPLVRGVSLLHFLPICNPEACQRNFVDFFPLPRFACDNNFFLIFAVEDLNCSADPADHAGVFLLGPAGFEKLLHPGQTLGDVKASHTTCVEGAHGQLGAGLADGLGGDNSYRLADLSPFCLWPGSCRSTSGRRRSGCGR